MLLLDDQLMLGMRGTLGGIGRDKQDLFRPGAGTYADARPPGSHDPRGARLVAMDAYGVDISLLYSTLGICREGEVRDPGRASACTSA